MTKLTHEQAQEMATLRERGWSFKRLANRFGVTTGAVHYRCLALGALSPKSQPLRRPDKRAENASGFGGRVRHFSADEDQRLLMLARNGKSIEQIGSELQRARTSVRIRLMTLELKAELA